ncbi:hypothetical protein OHA21_31720 [Actinoplanes sp. NBC_00393]|uniref:hypothetical protein n=1 Tax=Actinoplanes sp. NBC_00393 TaxID=2975953 RepID=UPI002E22C4CA
MSFSRRLAAGLPAAGVTLFAALALTGAPAAAAEPAGQGGYPAVMTSPDPGDTRGNAGYGGTAAEVPGVTSTTTAPTRGNPGYGGESPSATPTPSSSVPTGNVASVPPGGVQSETETPAPAVTTHGAGVSSGSTLPVTGAPLTGTLVFGGLLVAAGVTAVYYTRRRRSA